MKKSANEIRLDISKNNFLNKDDDGHVVGPEHLHVLEKMPHRNTHDTIRHEGMGTDTLIQDLFNMEHINDSGNVQKIGRKYTRTFNRARMPDDAAAVNNDDPKKKFVPKTTWDFKYTKRGISNRDTAIYYTLKELVNKDNPNSRKFWKSYDEVSLGDEICFSVDLANPKRDPYVKERPHYAYRDDGTEKESCWGHGVRLQNGKLEEVRTPGVRLVFERTDQDKAHPFGLAFKTAFPDAACKSAIRTGRDLTLELDEMLLLNTVKNQAAKAYIRATVMASPESDLVLEYHNGYQCIKADNEYGSELVPKDNLTAMNHFKMRYCARTNITNIPIEPTAIVYENGFIELNQDALKYTDELSSEFSCILEEIKEDLQLFAQKEAYAKSVRAADEIFNSLRTRQYVPQHSRSRAQKCQDEPER